jgi:quercetin 2,3-dioxygenase
MLTLRPAGQRGHAQHGWLDSWHSFSFADYRDPQHVHFGPLRVINEDRVQPGGGFAPHRHEDMEIISYVLDGELEHRDSLGTGSIIRPGDVQRMSAGRGVQHSEFNGSNSEPVHFLQIWILPNERGIESSYEEQHFSVGERRGRLRLIASPDRTDGSVLIHQDARVYAGLFDGGESATLELAPDRRLYLQVARGQITADGATLAAGDALKLTDTRTLSLREARQAEVLVFDLPGAAAA